MIAMSLCAGIKIVPRYVGLDPTLESDMQIRRRIESVSTNTNYSSLLLLLSKDAVFYSKNDIWVLNWIWSFSISPAAGLFVFDKKTFKGWKELSSIVAVRYISLEI